MAPCRVLNVTWAMLLVLPFAAPDQQRHASVFGVGDNAALHCDKPCQEVTWLHANSGRTTIKLFEAGKNVSAPNRVRLTDNCSLVITGIRAKDFGMYTCRRPSDEDSSTFLSVVKIFQRNTTLGVKLNCSVRMFGPCCHTVTWLFQGREVDKDHQQLRTSTSHCSATVEFDSAHFVSQSKDYDLLRCKLKNVETGEVREYPFNAQASEKKTGTETPSNSGEWWQKWWQVALVVVGLVAFIIAVVLLIQFKKSKGGRGPSSGNEAGMDENVGDPDEGVSYSTLRHKATTDSRIKLGQEAVTYSTVKTSFAEPCDLYATIHATGK